METLFLACFVFGALFTLVSLVVGFAGHGAAHLSHSNVHVGAGAHSAHVDAGPSTHSGHIHVGPSTHSGHTFAHDSSSHGTPPSPAAHLATTHPTALPWLNASSLIGALTWFGAAGYVLFRLGDWALPAVLLGALIAGAVGWYLVARFLGLVLSGEREMDPEDYRLEGTVCQLTVGIPAGGTGEVVFSKVGSRRSEAARALDGEPIARGSEVVITSYSDGFATVQPWGEFIAARDRVAAHNREAQQQA